MNRSGCNLKYLASVGQSEYNQLFSPWFSESLHSKLELRLYQDVYDWLKTFLLRETDQLPSSFKFFCP